MIIFGDLKVTADVKYREVITSHLNKIDDEICEKHYAMTHKLMEDGIYMLQIPFKLEVPDID